MMKDMILHTRNEESVRLGRTRVRLKAYSSAPWGALRTILLLLLMTVGVNGAWGQTDYSGTYFIGSRGYIPANTTTNTNFYLCPTEGWAFYASTNNVQGSDNGQPFLTTYQCRDGIYEAKKAIWNIEKEPNSGCYYIKQVSTGRYIVSNGVLSGAGSTRARVHLETVSNAAALAALGDLALFEINYDKDHYDILPHSGEGRDGNNIYLVVNTNNYNQLDGNNIKKNGPTGFKNCGGIIGLYTHPDDGNAYFYLEDAHCATPTISLDGTTGEVTIETTTTGATIYYTTNGSTPDPGQIGGDNPTKLYDTSNKPIISTETTIKAIAVEENHVNSLVASLSVSQVATPTIEDNGENGIIITCETEGATIFYTLDPSEEPATPYTSGTILREGFSNKTIRVIAKKSGNLNSEIGSGSVKLKCDPPIISQDEGKKFTLSATFPSVATLKYSINDENGTYYDYDGTPVPFTEYGDVIYAKTTHADYYDSDVTSLEMVKDLEGEGTAGSPYLITSQPEFALFVSWINNKAEKRSLHYKLQADINGGAVITQAFTGILEGGVKDDGSFYKISNLHHALFNTVNGGTVKNVILDNVSISGGTNVGAICNEANGDSRIYNCGILATNSTIEKDEDGYDHISSSSSTISGSGNVGGIVGLLDGTSRVINCFSYANVSGGSFVGGIVGYNNVASTNPATDLKTMVMNCMFYGEVSGSSIAPIYNGEIITNIDENKGVGNYNYFRLEASYVQPTGVTYNCALGAEDRYLQRFEFFRNLLNSHRELAGWWATGTYSSSEMMKWVLEPSQIGTAIPYPILKKPGRYHSVVNIDNLDVVTQRSNTIGTTTGTLTVNIQMGDGAVYQRPSNAAITTSQLALNITDKDPDHFNFNYHKVQLPYYNDVGTKNYNGNRVVTGWKIVSISGGTPGNFTTGDDAPAYNFADRNCTNKDLYGTNGSNRIFNQGAYWDVPEGVTAITIEPYWAKCVYLADPNADKVYNTTMDTGYDVPNVGGGTIYTNGNSYSIAGENQVVYTSIGKAIASTALYAGYTDEQRNNHSVYDYAVVLVGNYHHYYPNQNNLRIEASRSKPYTVTSIDLDGDNEPDYSYILRFDNRQETHPVRADFINIPGLGMAQKSTGGTGSYNFGIMIPKGWFEGTNTSLFRFTQFEYENSSRSATDALILQGGIMEQWVSYNQKGRSNNIPYIHVGGNVWFKEFHTGCHQDKNITTGFQPTKHSPISVTGGDFDEFYLTGLYVANVGLNNYADNAECYINGGRFGTVCGAAMEGIGNANGADNTGNITWIIQNADIKEFYAGGLNASKPVTGNLSTTIVDSHVDIFCGGPKFGDMSANKTVVTNATGCTFGTFFGAGYGGNSYSRDAPRNHNNIVNFPHNDAEGAGNHASWNAWLADKYKKNYDADKGGISTQFDYQFLPMSNNTNNVARIFVEYVAFSLATTHDVTSSLTGCTITGNFYGGGSLGKVEGDVTSTLTNCTVNGSVFGAGYSASLPTVEVMDVGFQTEPYYYEDLGTYRKGVFPTPTTTYHWEQATATEFSNKQVDNDEHILYTTADLTALGTVIGDVILNIDGTTAVDGDVYGGGESSNATGNSTVNMISGTLRQDIYGGGALANVDGNTKVNLIGGTVARDVYGGGKGRLEVVGKDAVGIEGEEDYEPAVEAVAPIAATVGSATVNLNGIDATDYKAAYTTLTREGDSGPYTVADDKKGCVIGRDIFGCNNLNGTPLGDVTVHVYATQNAAATRIANPSEGEKTAKVLERYDVQHVYGGGNLAAYEPTSNTHTTVIIDGCDRTSIYQVYGGGNAASTPATEININGTFEIKEAFGGGNGKDAITINGVTKPNPGANVGFKDYSAVENDPKWDTKEERKTNEEFINKYVYGSGKASVNIKGGTIHQVFGGSNTKGNVRITAVTMLEEVKDGSTNEAICSFRVDEAYGGGKSAPMDAEAKLLMACIPGLEAAYGGAEAADIHGNVELNITNGNFNRVFGGNNKSGTINGSITINIEETGCKPIIIGELYGGGNMAGYSTYGYKKTGTEIDSETGEEKDIWGLVKPTDPDAPSNALYNDPEVNVKSFTSIGDIYGGGYGETAVMVGNPTVNINVGMGGKTYYTDESTYKVGETDVKYYDDDGFKELTKAIDGHTIIIPQHKFGAIGAINNVFGGGNAAKVVGNTAVNIGTLNKVTVKRLKFDTNNNPVLDSDGIQETEEVDLDVVGADIRGNVYGGGNQAEVTGSTNVVIGKDATTTSGGN